MDNELDNIQNTYFSYIYSIDELNKMSSEITNKLKEPFALSEGTSEEDLVVDEDPSDSVKKTNKHISEVNDLELLLVKVTDKLKSYEDAKLYKSIKDVIKILSSFNIEQLTKNEIMNKYWNSVKEDERLNNIYIFFKQFPNKIDDFDKWEKDIETSKAMEDWEYRDTLD